MNMKRLLSLILALLFCLSFIVSCEKEESPSTSEPSSSSEEPGSSGKLSYDDRGLPIFPAPKDAYTYYNVYEKNFAFAECYDTWVFNDYGSYCGFISQYASIGDITEDMLNDYFLVVVYRAENIYATENYSYSNFNRINNEYILILEYTSYEIPYEDKEVPTRFDIVLIPRSECEESPADITVSLKKHIHRWE
ncbi:MAG: hypothetical protein IJW10_04345 [Clostridia bacterium]|nr:hypothetical protein [Clostridia bacterium]